MIGGGIVGLTSALAVKRRFTDASVLLIEKEDRLGAHASGRNSGVLHAGFYYPDESLKARFSRDGNRRMTEYCLERGLRINRCGKLVVAQTEEDHAGLDELKRRAATNSVVVEEVSEAEARRIEPRARTVGRALFSPTTSSVDPGEVIRSLESDARAAGIVVTTGVKYLRREAVLVRTSVGGIDARFVINAAGLYADVVARDFGHSARYRMLPFKGLYLKGDSREKLRTNIYPVPDLANPFAGVHFTVSVDGSVKIGPTATPAFWRENYGGFGGFSAAELVDVVGRESVLLARNEWGFRDLALAELRKHSRSHLARLAARLVPDMEPGHFRKWGPPGIRAQLLDTRTRRLVMDFVLEGDERSLHILNAVSPAFTSSLAFADHVADQVATLAA